MNAIELLKSDHRKVKQMFREFEHAGSANEKGSLAQRVFRELHVHTQLEEQIFYPTIRQAAEQRHDDKEKDLVIEGVEEHHVVDELIEQLQALDPSDEKYDSTFKVLTENVEHHIDEEENEMMPDAERLVESANMEHLGAAMMKLKQRLEA